jgi:hypothetical protein
MFKDYRICAYINPSRGGKKYSNLAPSSQSLFAMYDILPMWWKYCDEIIPPNQQLKRLKKVSLH